MALLVELSSIAEELASISSAVEPVLGTCRSGGEGRGAAQRPLWR